MIAEKILSTLSKTTASTASLIKILLKSKRATAAPHSRPQRDLVVLGNGPSLNDTVANHSDFLADKDLLAVNFAASSPLFKQLRPQLYLMADPLFFTSGGEEKFDRLWDAIRAADWGMTLFVPANYRRQTDTLLGNNSNVSLRYFNLTPIDGFRPLCHAIFRSGLGMPRPRNVLVPAIMEAIRLGYKRIYIAGADHSWSKTLWVDDCNRVVTVQPHFYPDDEKERERVAATYAGIHIHDIYNSFAIAFRSYFAIADYARTRGVEILNITPGSFIDAFPRLKL